MMLDLTNDVALMLVNLKLIYYQFAVFPVSAYHLDN